MSNTKIITVLLNRNDDFFAHLLCFFSKSRYSHVAISLDEEHNEFYSFSFNGFIVEHPFFRKKHSEYLEIKIPVTEKQYLLIKDEVEEFLRRKEELKYSKLGFVLLFFRIPARFKNRFFCSQFVADVLLKAGVVELQMDSSLYYPGWLIDRLKYRSTPMFIQHAAI